MRTIRRLYVYSVAFVSLEVVVWGLVALARLAFSTGGLLGGASELALSLALIVVGLPVFLGHWWIAQRIAGQDTAEERWAGVRAIFLYGVLLATLASALLTGLSLIYRLMAFLLGLNPELAGQYAYGLGWRDPLIAGAINAGAALYFFSIVRADWQSSPQGTAFPDVRRLYRYSCMVFGVILVVAGVQQTLSFIRERWLVVGQGSEYQFAGALALLVVGIPLWLISARIVHDSLEQPAECESLLRLAVLYGLTLAGVGSALVCAAFILAAALRQVLGEGMALTKLVTEIGGPLSAAVPLSGVARYYGRQLMLDMAAIPDAPRRAGLRRLYYYVLAGGGLAAAFVGLQRLISFLLEVSVATALWGQSARYWLANSVAILLVGLPLWWLTWRPMLAEAAAPDDAGDHARRSIVRKTYLYLILFVGVIGVMVTAGRLVFLAFSRLLGQWLPTYGRESLDYLQTLVLFLLVAGYHWLASREDSRLAERALAARHAQFPVLVLDPGDGAFGREISAAVQRQTPILPVCIKTAGRDAPEWEASAARAVVLPAALAANPPDALRGWLRDFAGLRLVVPAPAEGWLWLGGTAASSEDLARHAARAVRQLAEGQPVRAPQPPSLWVVSAWALAILYGVPVLLSIILSLLMGMGD